MPTHQLEVFVRWEIDLCGHTSLTEHDKYDLEQAAAISAAVQAREILLDVDNTAIVFECTVQGRRFTVDLLGDDPIISEITEEETEEETE